MNSELGEWVVKKVYDGWVIFHFHEGRRPLASMIDGCWMCTYCGQLPPKEIEDAWLLAKLS